MGFLGFPKSGAVGCSLVSIVLNPALNNVLSFFLFIIFIQRVHKRFYLSHSYSI